MASVDLGDTLFVHDAVDPSQYVTATFQQWQRKRTRPLDVRTYAGGRRRIITRPGQDEQMDIALAFVDPETVEALWGYAGSLVMVRGGRSELVYGVFDAVDEQDDGLDAGVTSVSLTLQLATFQDTV